MIIVSWQVTEDLSKEVITKLRGRSSHPASGGDLRKTQLVSRLEGGHEFAYLRTERQAHVVGVQRLNRGVVQEKGEWSQLPIIFHVL